MYVVVQLLSHFLFFAHLWTAAYQASLSFTVSEFAQIQVHLVGDAIQPSHPLSPPSPPALSLSQCQGLLFQCISRAKEDQSVLGTVSGNKDPGPKPSRTVSFPGEWSWGEGLSDC